MIWMQLLSYFFGGVFLANSLPHLVAGVMGEAFQSPFAKPPGQGRSSSTTNVLWSFFNLVLSYLLICQVGTFDLRRPIDVLPFALGLLFMALSCARQFARFNGGSATGA